MKINLEGSVKQYFRVLALRELHKLIDTVQTLEKMDVMKFEVRSDDMPNTSCHSYTNNTRTDRSFKMGDHNYLMSFLYTLPGTNIDVEIGEAADVQEELFNKMKDILVNYKFDDEDSLDEKEICTEP